MLGKSALFSGSMRSVNSTFNSANPEVNVGKIGLFFGSDEGNTERVAYRIQKRFGKDVVDVMDIADVTQLEFADYDRIILGIPTWDFGQIQSDWEESWHDIAAVDLSGTTLPLYGLGDQLGYGADFLHAVGMLHAGIIQSGPTIIGHWRIEGYEFDASKAEIPGAGMFGGLALDDDQQEHLTADRLNRWCAQIHAEFGLDTPLQSLDD